MRRASLKYLDAWFGSVMSADAEQLIRFCYVSGDGIRFLAELEVQMSLRALRHCNGKRLIMRAI
eukprot:1478084-Pyramimonas_sp.AAC.1